MSRFKMRVAVHLILEKDNKYLLLRRYNTGYEDGNYSVVMHRKANDESIDYFLYCNKFSGDISIMEPSKCDELSFYEMDNLPKNVIPYVRQAIDNK